MPFLHFLRHRRVRSYSVTASCLKNILPGYFAVEVKPTKETLFYLQQPQTKNILPSPFSEQVMIFQHRGKFHIFCLQGFLRGISTWAPCLAVVSLDFAACVRSR